MGWVYEAVTGSAVHAPGDVVETKPWSSGLGQRSQSPWRSLLRGSEGNQRVENRGMFRLSRFFRPRDVVEIKPWSPGLGQRSQSPWRSSLSRERRQSPQGIAQVLITSRITCPCTSVRRRLMPL